MTSIEERLLGRLDRSASECWTWTGTTDADGYGVLKVGGRAGVMRLTHRLSYEAFVGPIPDGLVIDHLCRNRACANPAHLEPATNRENILRGEGPSAQAARRTHCPQGHAYDDVNTFRGSDGRYCRTCRRERSRRTAAARRKTQDRPETKQCEVCGDTFSVAPRGFVPYACSQACRSKRARNKGAAA